MATCIAESVTTVVMAPMMETVAIAAPAALLRAAVLVMQVPVPAVRVCRRAGCCLHQGMIFDTKGCKAGGAWVPHKKTVKGINLGLIRD